MKQGRLAGCVLSASLAAASALLAAPNEAHAQSDAITAGAGYNLRLFIGCL
jgi:hypothetical protein